MICTIAEIIAVLAESYLAAHLLIKYFGLKEENLYRLKQMSFFFFLTVSDLLGTFWIKNETFMVISCLATEIVFAVIFLNGNYFEKIFLSITSYILVYAINFPTLALISVISNSGISELTVSQNITRIVCLFITKLLYFAAVQLILWGRKKEKHYFNLNEWIIIISVFLMTLLIGLAMYLIMLNEKISDYVYLASTILLSSLDVIIFIFMKKMNISSQKEREKELLQIQLAQQQNEMRQLEHQYQEICVLRHDFKNSIDCIARMIQQNKREDALHYAEQLKKRKIGNIQTHIECSSSVINAVLNSKFSDAHDKDIATSFKMVVQIPESLEFDISIILSNLLDNAIEACCKNDAASRIVLSITKNNAYYQLLIKNTIVDSVLEWNKSLKTIKAGKNEHGWGMKSIFDIVEKHQGMIEIFEENGEFCVCTLLKEVL